MRLVWALRPVLSEAQSDQSVAQSAARLVLSEARLVAQPEALVAQPVRRVARWVVLLEQSAEAWRVVQVERPLEGRVQSGRVPGWA